MKVLPPGTILQLMYFKKRLHHLSPGQFIEIGPGAGEITAILLGQGWSGRVFDYDADTCNQLRDRFKSQVAAKQLQVIQGDYLANPQPEKVDLVISCMVMEHFNDEQESAFLKKAFTELKLNGRCIAFVPASQKHWGIEDEIAGHYRRYNRQKIRELVAGSGAQLIHMSGLTWPLSNVLLPISNFLVKRAESSRLKMDMLERTKYSGKRSVLFKTSFPDILGLVLNPITLLPLHYMQMLFSNVDSALVLYFEAIPERR